MWLTGIGSPRPHGWVLDFLQTRQLLSYVPEGVCVVNWLILYLLVKRMSLLFYGLTPSPVSLAQFSILFSALCIISHKGYGNLLLTITARSFAGAMTLQSLSFTKYLSSWLTAKTHRRSERTPLCGVPLLTYLIAATPTISNLATLYLSI